MLLIATSIFFALLVAFWFTKTGSADPYGDFHVELNRVAPGNVETEWLNMGYWKDTDVFPKSCEALALKLVQATNFPPGARVLDVGHGSGESLLFLLSHPDVPRPSHITGITSLEEHYIRSQARLSCVTSKVPVVLHVGDAIRRAGVDDHPFNNARFDAILALDCAYHFKHRRDFIQQAYDALQSGGSLGLADICFAPETLNSLRSRLITFFLRLMPKGNMVSTEDYCFQMKAAGFVDVELEDISQDVFPGFIRFLQSRGFGWSIFASVLSLYYSTGARFVVSVLIPRYEERSKPSPHTVYEIKVKANIRDWSIWRRYSEFDDLDRALRDATHEAPPAPLPSKHSLSIFRSHSDPKLLEERRTGLELYLRAILSAKDDKWRESYLFRQFLGMPVGKQSETVQTYTLASWLDEHIELQARIRDVRADINKRDALSDRGDTNGAHSSNVAAKKQLAGVISRLGKLAEGLQDLAMGGMSEGELHRRTDMVARLRDDCEKLGKMVTVARQIARPGASSSRNPAPDSDRDALMGSPTSKPFGRVFGAAAKPRETEETRPLDDHGLFMLQEAKMQQQDSEVSQLTAVLQRQRHLGEAISNELALQIELLDDLANRVDDTSGKLQSANRQMGRLR
ncbi:Snare domain containing protein [Mycena indigotica]|uniref:phosphoethanolamine N-methyltransferase n=1 Tax=Mycena indigotica TaxID=2126181 RepID=A0A8H6SX51_9AGAR|nr:Snare domain containing protein [Mycena indigotica]KAF7306979.1 Snare domain containing protein [Mycena indigotica]